MVPADADDACPPDLLDLVGLEWLYVDAMNVIGSRPDGWWRDRDAAVVRFAAGLDAFAADVTPTVVLVVDGRPIATLPEGRHGGIEVTYARRRGPDGADDRIVDLLDTRPGEPATVVTADRGLRARVRSRGARIVSPRRLQEVLGSKRPAP